MKIIINSLLTSLIKLCGPKIGLSSSQVIVIRFYAVGADGEMVWGLAYFHVHFTRLQAHRVTSP